MTRPATGPLPSSLIDRFGVRTGMRVAVVGVQAPGLVAAVRARCGSVTEIALATDPSLAGRGLPDLGALGSGRDVVLFFAESAEALALLPRLARALTARGALWVLWPRGRAEVGQSSVLAAGLSAGLVDTDEVRATDRLSGIRFVAGRRESTGAPRARRG